MSRKRKILFVCTGNICRSPMAEGIFNHRVAGRSDWTALSAGTCAFPGQPASLEAQLALAEWGMDIRGHQSQPVTEELVEAVDLIVTMTEGHREMVLEQAPRAARKTRLLTSFGSGQPAGIPDPIGGSLDVYRRTRDRIEAGISDLILYIRDQGGLNGAPSERAAKMNMVIGADHGGLEIKEAIKAVLARKGVAVEDVGTHDKNSVDYPDFAQAVTGQVAAGKAAQGILICTTGVGMSIAANRVPGIRAALVHNAAIAKAARQHNDANVLVLGATTVAPTAVEPILDAWLSTTFERGGRHERRVEKMEHMSAAADGLDAVALADPDIFHAISEEAVRQRQNIELIASENYTSRAVRQASGCIMTNKYAEGYPGKRWYGGCECVDIAEKLAIERAKQLFGAEHANVQPHSGSQANMAVYFSVLNPGDTILAMNLAHGGHLTHGHKANFSGRLYNIVPYGVDKDSELIDYAEVARLANEHKPKLICAGASAYSRIIDFVRLREIADTVGAYLMVDMAHIAGLVAGGVHPSPVPHADFVTTTTHKTLRGPRGGLILCREKFAADVDRQMFPGVQGGPLMHIIAAKAICLYEALQPSFRLYAEQVVKNAAVMAKSLTAHGMRIVSGGTDNHLMLVDLNPVNVSGKDASTALDKASITVNKNAIPFDTKSPFVTSGIRVGTPAVTTRGMKEAEMEQIAACISRVLKDRENEKAVAAIREEILALSARFPVP